jgi:hypothetical protein
VFGKQAEFSRNLNVWKTGGIFTKLGCSENRRNFHETGMLDVWKTGGIFKKLGCWMFGKQAEFSRNLNVWKTGGIFTKLGCSENRRNFHETWMFGKQA